MRSGRVESGQRGSAVVFTLVWLPVLLLCAGLAADLGNLFVVRYLLWTAADQGALAGARQVDLDALAEGQVRLDEAEAVRTAREVVTENLEATFGNFAGIRIGVDIMNTEVRVMAELRTRTTFLALILPDVPIKVEARAQIVKRKITEPPAGVRPAALEIQQ